MADPALLLVAEIHGLAGRAGELEDLLEGLAAGVRDEPGCVSFAVSAVLGAPGEYRAASGWADEASMRAHFQSAPYRRYRQAVSGLLARASDVTVHHVTRTDHPIDPGPVDPALAD